MNTTQDRTARLADINAQLADLGLRPLKDLGDHTHGEIELTGIHQVFDHSKRFFTDVQFDCTFPNGSQGLYAIRWNANSLVADGAVMVVIINGRIAFTRQYRNPFGTWMTELPRGFGEKVDQAVKVSDLPVANALRELDEEVISGAQIEKLVHLGAVAQDSSTHMAVPNYWLVNISVDEQALSQRLKTLTDEGIALQLWSAEKAFAAIGGKIADAHSIVGLTLYRQYLEAQAA